MTVGTTLDAAGWLRNHLDGDGDDSDLARSMLQALMSAEASMQCQAGYGERSEERTNSRNGYRERRWDTRVGSIDLAVPKLREGTYYPAWLLTHRRRAEQALAPVVAQAHVEGVSTRRVDDPHRFDQIVGPVRAGRESPGVQVTRSSPRRRRTRGRSSRRTRPMPGTARAEPRHPRWRADRAGSAEPAAPSSQHRTPRSSRSR